jgi:hypothetical protein
MFKATKNANPYHQQVYEENPYLQKIYNTFEEITMSYPYSVEISDEHDGEDIQDWLLENGWGHQMDWKALRMRHKGVYSIHFLQVHMAMLTKLRWGGQ